MAFPNLKPASRDFNSGDWPIKRFNAQSGAEVRILYGTRRVNAKLNLTYQNIKDTDAQLFLDDYEARKGTLQEFSLSTASNVWAGWNGTTSSINAPPGTNWRYDSEPKVQSVYKGLSNVQVTLIAVA
jgi:hypothetical protein